MKSYKAIFLSIISAILLILAYPLANLWLLAWVALVPLFIAIDPRREQACLFPTVFLLGFLAGLVFFYGAISWLNSIAIMATIALVLYLALYFALFAMFATAILKINLPVFLKCVFIASCWVVLEFIRSNLMTGFGWALLGYSQSSFLPVIQIADIAGAYGVSFIVVFTNVVIYEFFAAPSVRDDCEAKPKQEAKQSPSLLQNRLINFLLCSFLIVFIFLYGFYKLGKEIASVASLPRNDGGCASVKISLIQGNIPQSLKWDDAYRGEIIKRYFDLTLQAAKDKPDIIIWPETSFPADLELEPILAKNLFNLSKAANTYLLIGANRYKNRNIYNSAFLIGPDGIIRAHYDKMHLVPFGEFMPKIPKFMYKILPDKINMVGDFTSGKEYTVFQMHKNVIARNDERERGVTKQSPSSKEIASLPSVARNDVDVRFSTLICFEDVFPELSRQMVKNGANMLVNITNDGWYGISGAPFQHAQASVFRAVENRVPVVRAANTGYSVFIDEKGRIIDRVPPFTASYKTKDVFVGANLCVRPVMGRHVGLPLHTFYNTHPYIFIGISFLLSFIGFGIILDIVKISKIKS